MKKLFLIFFVITSCSTTNERNDLQNNYLKSCNLDSVNYKNYPIFNENISDLDKFFNEIESYNRPVKDDWETDTEYSQRLNQFLQQYEVKKIYKTQVNIDFPCSSLSYRNFACYDVNSNLIKITIPDYFGDKEYQLDYKSEYSNTYDRLFVEKTIDKLDINFKYDVNESIFIPRDEMKIDMPKYKFYVLFSIDMLGKHQIERKTSSDWGERITTRKNTRILNAEYIGHSLEKDGKIINQNVCS